MAMKSANLNSFVSHMIGGGWGSEAPDIKNTERVAIIRGTDIPKISAGIFSTVPIRYESANKVRSRLLEEGDLVIEVSGGSAKSNQRTGRTLLITNEILKKLGGNVIPASFCKLIRFDKQKIDSAYVSYQIAYLHQTDEIANYEVQSTGLTNFQTSHFLSDVEPYLLDIDEQRSASYPLLVLDKKISILRETNNLFEKVISTLFKSWFVSFDPTVDSKNLRNEFCKGIDFPSSFERDEYGMIPKGWSRVKFGDLLIDVIGGDWGSDLPNAIESERVAIVRGTDLPELSINIPNKIPIRYTTSRKISSRLIEPGDIIIEVSGGSKDQPTGRSLYFTESMLRQFNIPVVPASFCRRLRPRTIKHGLLLACHLNEIYRQGKTWEYQVQSTGISNFQTKHFLESEMVVVPTDDVIDRFFEIVQPMLQRSGLSEIQELTRLKNSILSKLITEGGQ